MKLKQTLWPLALLLVVHVNFVLTLSQFLVGGQGGHGGHGGNSNCVCVCGTSHAHNSFAEFGNVELGGTTYYFSPNEKSWSEAQDTCRSMGMELATITNEDQQRLIAQQVNKLGLGNVWIGGTDAAKEGSWIWSANGHSVSFSKWYGNEPSGGENQNCMLIYSDQKWYDYYCAYKEHYLCQKIYQ